MTIAKEVTGTLDFADPGQVGEAELAKARVQMEIQVDGKDSGAMTFEFWPQAAPKTVRNFLRYASAGFYDGLGFHRIISGFMVQGGDPKGDGTGSGPHGTIPGEFSQDSRYSHRQGVISMARSQDPDSASCQFFICHGDPTFLDGQYAAFGRLVDGEKTLEALAGTPTRTRGGEKSAPTVDCRIARMRVLMEE